MQYKTFFCTRGCPQNFKGNRGGEVAHYFSKDCANGKSAFRGNIKEPIRRVMDENHPKVSSRWANELMEEAHFCSPEKTT